MAITNMYPYAGCPCTYYVRVHTHIGARAGVTIIVEALN